MSLLWPPSLIEEPSTLTTWVRDDWTVQGIPGMARSLQLYCGLTGQMPMELVNESNVIEPTPSVLKQPDPSLSRFNYVGSSVRDWWIHGNTLSLVLGRDQNGYVAGVKYFPAHMWGIREGDDENVYLAGRPVPWGEVIHVQRGVDPFNTKRGIGVVEQHLRSFQRLGYQEAYEQDALSKAGVPSVAVIAPQKELTQKEADEAADAWERKFSGPGRRPGIFPAGTDIKTLSWNPSDQQLVMARQLGLTDIANIMNLDGYFLGAPGSSHTYRSAGSMFVALIRMSLEPVMAPFEDTWGRHFAPAGCRVRFARRELTRDDLQTMVTTGKEAVDAGLMSVDEWRELMGWTPFGTASSTSPRNQSRESRALAELVQKIYLGVGRVVSADEARQVLRAAGMDLSDGLPDVVAHYEESVGVNPNEVPILEGDKEA